MTPKKKYELFHPDHETIMQNIIGMKNAINSENFSRLFEDAGLLEKKPEDWIPTQIFLDIFNELSIRGGEVLDFVSIGIRLGTDAEFPDEFMALPFESQLATLGPQYDNFHRGTNIGYLKSDLVELRHTIFRVKTPFPDDFWYGVMYGLAKRFLPSRMRFKVYYDPDKPRREQGGEETIIHVEWWEKEEK